MHEWESCVRDYEVDSYGGVNAATYLNYMEEARKQFLTTLGFDLPAMYKRNLGFVVGRYEIDYLASLISGERFIVETSMERISRLRVEFTQGILKASDRKYAVKCVNVGLPINVKKNRAEWPIELDELLKDYPIRSSNLSNR